MDLSKIENDLISEIKLTRLQAKIFLVLVTKGKMNTQKIASNLHISVADALEGAKKLVELGSVIEISTNEFETMHPRFTAVNMYRKMCERNHIDFKRNNVIDNIGIALEKPYEDARTK